MALNRNFDNTSPGKNMVEYRTKLPTIFDNIEPTTITCYTDGSKTDTVNGAGFFITTENNNTIIY